MIKNKILLIGPVPEPTTGVSLANKIVIDNLPKRKKFQIDFINTSFNKFDENLGVFSLSKLLFYLKLNLFIYKVFKSDIIYITPGQTFYGVVKYSLFIIVSKLLRKEVVIHVHGNYLGKEYSLLKGLKRRIFKSLLSSISKGIVLSESLTENMSPFIDNDKIFILYNFVENYLFLEDTILLKSQENNAPKIIFLSNLMQEKGIFDLLDALCILEEHDFYYEAKIAGNIDAKNRSRIEKYFKKLKNTSYCGVVSGEEKKTLLLWGNIFVLPTYYAMEGQPISILENMATGNLILTTKHAGIPDIFEENLNGFFVKKKNSESIAEKLKYIVANPEICNRIRQNNYASAKTRYRVDNFINNIVDIFEA